MSVWVMTVCMHCLRRALGFSGPALLLIIKEACFPAAGNAKGGTISRCRPS